jgi:antitoxin component YwqK of YwqJK toxin-antitoxin module
MVLFTRYLVLALCFALTALQSDAQMRRRTKQSKEFYESGKIKKVTRTKTVQSIYIDPYTFFKKTITHATEYYENGKIKSKTYRKTRIDKSTPGCYEVKVIVTTYSEDGTIQHEEINECDKKRITNKFYDASGKITFIRINYYLS